MRAAPSQDSPVCRRTSTTPMAPSTAAYDNAAPSTAAPKRIAPVPSRPEWIRTVNDAAPARVASIRFPAL